MNTDSENILKNNFFLHFNYLFVKIRDNSPATAKRSEDGWLKISLSTPSVFSVVNNI